MRKLVLGAAATAVGAILAAQAPATKAQQDSVNPQEIIQKFAAKEAEFREARNNYTYRQTVKMEELDAGGNPTGGKWEEVDDILFNPDNGKRLEKVIKAPVVNLQHISLDPEDVSDLRDVQPFVLTTQDIPKYSVDYLGREKIDEIGCFTFSVKPKKMVKGERYFEGEIWVDDRDYQIVKTYGKGVGLTGKDHQFPKFETYREQVDGKYWFPTYTHADDTLHFKDMDQRIRMVVRYADYKKYEGKSTIRFGNVVDDTKKSTSEPPATKKK
jgi:hypothetical protein